MTRKQKTFCFEIILDSQEVTKYVEGSRVPLFSPASPDDNILYINNILLKPGN